MLFKIQRFVIEVYERVTFLSLRQRSKAAFRLTIATLDALRSAIVQNTATVAANTAEQSLVRSRLDTLVKQNDYLVRARQQELRRQGHEVI